MLKAGNVAALEEAKQFVSYFCSPKKQISDSPSPLYFHVTVHYKSLITYLLPTVYHLSREMVGLDSLQDISLHVTIDRFK